MTISDKDLPRLPYDEEAEKPTEVPPRADRPIVVLDEENLNIFHESRLRKLRERGWQGSLEDWVRAVNESGEDPLDHDPPITTLRGTSGRVAG